jgi:FKBP-type peptidyl-prolyl cis-trans isomerase SlyD
VQIVRVERDRVVAIDYTLRRRGGEVIESSLGGAPLRYLHGRAQLVPGIERAIDGAQEGDELELELDPDSGYGKRDPEGVFLVPRAAFPEDEPIRIGSAYSALRPDGEPVLFRVVRFDRDTVLVDTNHPLAGEWVRVWIAVREVRDATTQELFHGFVKAESEPALEGEETLPS